MRNCSFFFLIIFSKAVISQCNLSTVSTNGIELFYFVGVKDKLKPNITYKYLFSYAGETNKNNKETSTSIFSREISCKRRFTYALIHHYCPNIDASKLCFENDPERSQLGLSASFGPPCLDHVTSFKITDNHTKVECSYRPDPDCWAEYAKTLLFKCPSSTSTTITLPSNLNNQKQGVQQK